MNDKTNKALEYVSALMDGEALTDEMLDAVLADEEALRAWHEYHIIGDCIRQGAAASVIGETMQSKAFTVPQTEAEGKQEKYAQREAAIAASSNSLRPLPACVRLLLQYGNLHRKLLVTLCRLQRSLMFSQPKILFR